MRGYCDASGGGDATNEGMGRSEERDWLVSYGQLTVGQGLGGIRTRRCPSLPAINKLLPSCRTAMA